MLMPLHEYRTTVCCSKCGERTTAPDVTDCRTHRRRKSTRLSECPACKQRWEQGGEEGTVGVGGWGGGSGSKGEQSGGGKEGGQAGGGEGEGVGEGRAQAGGGMWDGGGWGPCSSPVTERKCEETTACVPDAQRLERGMEPVERFGCRVCRTA